MRDKVEKWVHYFIAFSFIGWVYEVLVFAFELHYGFVNRGFLFGPWLPVYGCGGVLILVLLKDLRDKKIYLGKINVTPIVCFLFIVLISTATELLTSYLMEWTTGSWLWDYSADGLNFQGRIALKSSIRFGLIGITVLYLIQPGMELLFEKAKYYQNKVYHAYTGILISLFALDVLSRVFLGGNYVGP